MTNHAFIEIKEVKTLDNPKVFKTILYSNNIIEVQWDKELLEIDKIHLISLKEFIKELGNENKMLIYTSILDFVRITTEGRRYGASDEGQEYTKANAILVDNMAKKIVFNFFMNINKPKTPTKSFSTKEEAFKWLLEHDKYC